MPYTLCSPGTVANIAHCCLQPSKMQSPPTTHSHRNCSLLSSFNLMNMLTPYVNTAVNRSLHSGLGGLHNIAYNDFRQASAPNKGNLLTRLASSTNTANSLIGFSNIFKDRSASLQVCPNPVQPLDQSNTPLIETSKGLLRTPHMASSNCTSAALSSQLQPAAGHVTTSIDISMSSPLYAHLQVSALATRTHPP